MNLPTSAVIPIKCRLCGYVCTSWTLALDHLKVCPPKKLARIAAMSNEGLCQDFTAKGEDPKALAEEIRESMLDAVKRYKTG